MAISVYPTADFTRQLRDRWSHTEIADAALMTFLSRADNDADADRQLRASGKSSLNQMLAIGLLNPDITVVEIGCGCGRIATELAPWLHERGGQYIGVDVSPSYIELCKRRCSLGKFVVTDGFGFPLPSESVDLVIEQAVFCHMTNHHVWLWLRDCERVLKPSGQVYLQFHNFYSTQIWQEFLTVAKTKRFLKDVAYPRGTTLETVQWLLQQAGLCITQTVDVSHDQGPVYCWFVIAKKPGAC